MSESRESKVQLKYYFHPTYTSGQSRLVIANRECVYVGTDPATYSVDSMAAIANALSRLAVPAIVAVGVVQASIYDGQSRVKESFGEVKICVCSLVCPLQFLVVTVRSCLIDSRE